jgi:hypothetical protein
VKTGDFNDDGVLDSLDLALLKSIVAEYKQFGESSPIIRSLSAEQLARLDVNGDGKIDYDDVVALCKRLVDAPLPATPEQAAADARFARLRARLNH